MIRSLRVSSLSVLGIWTGGAEGSTQISRDECSLLCDTFSVAHGGLEEDLCGSSGSRCEGSICTSLFWSELEVSLICSEVEQLTADERTRPLSCSAARELLTSRGIALPPVIQNGDRDGASELEEAMRLSMLSAAEMETQHQQRLDELRRRAASCTPSTEIPDPEFAGLSEEEIIARICQRSVEQIGKPGQVYVVDNRPGHIGFHNLGATCYMNSIMQLLGHSDRFIGYMTDLSMRFYDYPHMNSLTLNVMTTLNEMWVPRNGGEPITARTLQDSLREFSGFEYPDDAMEDASLALGHVLEAIDVASNNDFGRRMTNIPVETFRTCRSCDIALQVRNEPDRILRLPIARSESPVDLQACFGIFAQQHDVELVECPSCRHRGGFARTRYSIRGQGPNVLIIQLLRFQQVGATQVKIQTPIDYPLEFDLSRMPGASTAVGMYRLKGVVHHSGDSIRGGHFTTEVHHMMDGEWLVANDRDVHEIASPLQHSTTAYILLYDRFEL